MIFVTVSHQDRTLHKVNDPKADYSGDLEEGKDGHEPRVEPCWSVLLINPLSAMWAVSWTPIWVQARMLGYSLN